MNVGANDADAQEAEKLGKIDKACHDGDKSFSSPSAHKSEAAKPPLSCVVINSTPESADQNGGGFFTSPNALKPAPQKASLDDYPAPPTSFNSSFKLMPRKLFSGVCTPSPSSRKKTAPRGLKRSAVSMSSPVTSDQVSPGSLPSPKQPPSAPDEGLYKLQQLSLRSPITEKSTSSDDMKSPPPGSNPDFAAQRTSSFSVYSASSPSGSVNAKTSTGSISGSVSSAIHASRTPCSSAKSSPRHVPLTVLSGPLPPLSASPAKTPTNRLPPAHSVMSSMLYSIEADDDSPDSYRNKRRITNPETSTPRATSSSEPVTPQPVGISPRTPLPRVTLTPRTPLSIRRGAKPLPTLASPSDDGISSTPHSKQSDEMSSMMDSLLGGFPRAQKTRVDTSSDSVGFQAMSSFARAPPASSNSLDFSQDGSQTAQTSSPLKQEDSLQSLQSLKSELAAQDETQEEKPFVPFVTIGTELTEQNGTPLRRNRRSKRGVSEEEGATPIIRSRSLLQAAGRDIFEEIIKAEARVGVVDAETGSLSDSDDDHEFVLASPKQITCTHNDTNQRAKQRRKRSVENFAAICVSRNKSLTSFGSNTSLLGMDIVHEGGDQSSASTTTPFSMISSKIHTGSGCNLNQKDGEHGSSGSLRRLKSDHSLGSLGLPLDGPSNLADRDLVTPPVTMQKTSSPPPLLHNGVRESSFVE